MAREFALLWADLHREWGYADGRDVLLIGYKRMFYKYIPGLPEDSALMRKLRAPHEKRDQAKADLQSKFREIHG